MKAERYFLISWELMSLGVITLCVLYTVQEYHLQLVCLLR